MAVDCCKKVLTFQGVFFEVAVRAPPSGNGEGREGTDREGRREEGRERGMERGGDGWREGQTDRQMDGGRGSREGG